MLRSVCVGTTLCLFFFVSACDSKENTSTNQVNAQAPTEKVQAGAAKKEVASKSGSFEIVEVEHEVLVGASSELAFELRPGKGFKINPEYPWKFKVDDAALPDGVSLEQDAELKKGAMDLTAARARVPVKLTASKDGEHVVEGSLNLSICEKGNEARCLWFTDEPVTLKVSAKTESVPEKEGAE